MRTVRQEHMVQTVRSLLRSLPGRWADRVVPARRQSSGGARSNSQEQLQQEGGPAARRRLALGLPAPGRLRAPHPISDRMRG